MENRFFDINQPLTPDLCEFLGAISGDGFTNKYGRSHQTGFVGDSRYDMDYYTKVIAPIAKKHFNIPCSIYKRKTRNAVNVNLYSRLLFEMLTKRFGIPAGVKFDKVLVPNEILNGNMEHKIAFLRGAFDTDGCVFFDKRKTYKEPYMRVDITMYNIAILTQLHNILKELEIESKVLGNGKHLQVTSKKDVRKFFEKIGSSNERHRAKIRQKYSDFDEWNPAKLPVS